MPIRCCFVTLGVFKRALIGGGIFLCAAGGTTAAGSDAAVALPELLRVLVEKGVLTEDDATAVLGEAHGSSGNLNRTGEPEDGSDPVDEDVIRVPYLPDAVRDAVRDELVRETVPDVTEQVVTELRTQAKAGSLAAVWPEWLRGLRLYGDLRYRVENIDYNGDSNAPGSVIDWQAVNGAGGVLAAGPDAFLNTTQDRFRTRLRVRLGVEAELGEWWAAGVRLSTGNSNVPVTTNQTLGDYGNRGDILLDRGFIQYFRPVGESQALWFSAGRMANPYQSTSLVWDADLGFEGVSTRYTHGAKDRWGQVSVTAGWFALQEQALTTDDKSLAALQLAGMWDLGPQAQLRAAAAYYDFSNLQARPVTTAPGTCDLATEEQLGSVPPYLQKGNSLAAICISGTAGNPGAAEDVAKVGLASEFEVVAFTLGYDWAWDAHQGLSIDFEYATNLGFDATEILRRTGQDLDEQVDGWHLKLALGVDTPRRLSDWSVQAGYKRIERDALVDAFTDSDFHLGGTNARGWYLSGQYGLHQDVWLSLRWVSSNSIEGPTFEVDQYFVDLSARY